MILATVSLAARWWTDKRGTFTVTGWEPTVALSMSVAGVVVLVAFTVTTSDAARPPPRSTPGTTRPHEAGFVRSHVTASPAVGNPVTPLVHDGWYRFPRCRVRVDRV
jgi:hypothetical protein